MDGIDGLVSIEAISTSLSVFLILYLIYPQYQFTFLYLYFAASIIGFLPWNFPAARIFMGDCCAYFIGLMICLFSLNTNASSDLFWIWLIMLGVFTLDSSLTLIKRLFDGKNIFNSHKDHAYQKAAEYWRSHKIITLSVLVINLAWLFPISLLVGFEILPGMVGLVIAYSPLVYLWMHINKLDSMTY